MYSFDEVQKTDPEIAQAIVDEQNRQNSHIELIASENWVSKAVWLQWAVLLPTNTQRAIQAKDITVAANTWMLWKRLPLNAQKNCSAVIMSMYSRIPVPRRTSLYSLLYVNPATLLWE